MTIRSFKIITCLLIYIFLCPFSGTGQNLYNGSGTIRFISNAPLETIRASSDELTGILAFEKNSFAFSFPVKSFDGFNSPLQKEHFNEHYLETAKYPKATFTGKIIGLDECDIDCETKVYAKGKLDIHGITNIVTIPVQFKKQGNSIDGSATFRVSLSDYAINIPKILEAKIAPVIDVTVEVQFEVQE
jgi:polyisoprenoid-binding protein YceI